MGNARYCEKGALSSADSWHRQRRGSGDSLVFLAPTAGERRVSYSTTDRRRRPNAVRRRLPVRLTP